MIKKIELFIFAILSFVSFTFGVSNEVESLIVYYHNTLDLEKSVELADELKPNELSTLLKAYLFLADSVEKYYGKSESYIESLIKNVNYENIDLYEVVDVLKVWRFDSITKIDGKFEKLLKEFPNSLVVILEAMRFYHYSFRHYFYESSYKNLLDLFERIKKLNPSVATPYIWLIDAMKTKEEYEKIKTIIEDSLKNADCFVLRDFLAKFYFEKGDFKKAIENSKIALKSKEKPEDFYILGISLWKLKEVDEARKILERLIEKEGFDDLNFKEQAETYKVLGNIYESHGKLKKAIEFYKLAFKKNSNDPNVLKALGMIYLKTSDPDRETYARYYLNLALKVRPNWPEVEEVLNKINKRFIKRVFLKYVLPILILVVFLLILLEIVGNIKKKKELRRLMHQ
ncbi:MAG TPA: tetratricopeptide repeat protein [Thermotogaceae bacterium]|nr:tetratricopeptide repeat protein [Thermotogaceae bacterium]